MDFSNESRVLHRCSAQVLDIGNLLLLSLWHLVHSIIRICNFTLDIANVLESYLISSGLLGRYKSLHIAKLRYLAIVIESEEAYQTSKIIELLQWLEAVGVKHVCLYDKEGILKKSKDFILENLDGAILFQDAHENNVLLDQQHMTLEFVSFSDGKEAVAKAANVLFMKYSKSGVTDQNQKEKIFTESQMSEALKTVGSGGPEPDLLLVYGPARCHLGFPAWRIKYTEIVHMGPLKSMNYGSLIKAIYKFTMVRQNYGK
ncbi:hypothetical protein E1A91_D12G018900v1 [Gossypium mustelinum]|uniref:ditrans,polycis-polyprenyl diphosphate synthase [(2E,6E)-farnesyldiphosphate specific] n=2 Tax=Gossypium TaxID=3633 RepID=A0A5D2S9K6_GOSMU|nr:hypothetical protein ES332_D12G019600v1 [Gossypium tomentosum]TYI49210.1 hypothetical protein E1A91_D12G018900v1 [Gossypium mustelinum]